MDKGEASRASMELERAKMNAEREKFAEEGNKILSGEISCEDEEISEASERALDRNKEVVEKSGAQKKIEAFVSEFERLYRAMYDNELYNLSNPDDIMPSLAVLNLIDTERRFDAYVSSLSDDEVSAHQDELDKVKEILEKVKTVREDAKAEHNKPYEPLTREDL